MSAVLSSLCLSLPVCLSARLISTPLTWGRVNISHSFSISEDSVARDWRSLDLVISASLSTKQEIKIKSISNIKIINLVNQRGHNLVLYSAGFYSDSLSVNWMESRVCHYLRGSELDYIRNTPLEAEWSIMVLLSYAFLALRFVFTVQRELIMDPF